MLKCRLTGQIPHSPVITPNGVVYEKDAIEQYLLTNSQCPIDGVPLKKEDLIPLKIDEFEAYPAEVRNSSFAQLLASLQAEYDSVQTELHSLRTKLATTQRELAQALYENDAARRVIARMYTIIQNGGYNAESVQPSIEISEPSAPDLHEFFFSNARQISSQRRHEKISRSDLSLSLSAKYLNFQNLTIPSRLPEDSFLTAIDSQPSQILLIGSSNGTILAIDWFQQQVLSLVQAHRYPIIALDSSADHTHTLSADTNGFIALWNRDDTSDDTSTILTKPYITTDLNSPIVSIQWHPAYQHIFVCLQNGHLLMLDANTLEVVCSTEAKGHEYCTASLHCDGYIIAAGFSEPDPETGAGTLEIWDACFEKLVQTIPLPTPPIDVKFSPAGKLLAVAGPNYIRLLLANDTTRFLDIKTKAEITGITFDDAGYMMFVYGKDQSTIYTLKVSSLEISAEEKVDLPVAGGAAKIGTNGTFIAVVNGLLTNEDRSPLVNDLQLVVPQNADEN